MGASTSVGSFHAEAREKAGVKIQKFGKAFPAVLHYEARMIYRMDLVEPSVATPGPITQGSQLIED
jgi:hypothetical protein